MSGPEGEQGKEDGRKEPPYGTRPLWCREGPWVPPVAPACPRVLLCAGAEHP